MRIFSSLLLTAILLPQFTFAESFGTAQDIELSASVRAPRSVLLNLDPVARALPPASLRIVNSEGTAVAFSRIDDQKNHMQDALFDAVPIAAGTEPQTDVQMMLDSSVSTAFQPVIGTTQKFRFHFAEPIAPTTLEYTMDSGDISGVNVRIGNSYQALRDAYVGVPSNNKIELSGETARVFEVVFTVRQGVARFAEMKLFESRSRLLFRAVPNQSYALLSGGDQSVSNPRDTSLTDRDAVTADLGSKRGLNAAESGDHDGIAAGDNCPAAWNPEQEDKDGDGAGDVCDTCPQHANVDQADADKNGRGDVCEDNDRDGIINAVDNCPDVRNTAQQDEDKDGAGNACDNDDNRFTASKPWLLWAGMAMIIIVLAGIGMVIMKRQ